MIRGHNNQYNNRPSGWLYAGIIIPVQFTARQEKYATRCVGIARSVYNQMVITHRMARAHGDGRWPNSLELSKAFNALKHEPEFGMTYTTEVSKFVAQGACIDFGRAYESWLNKDLKNKPPKIKRKNYNGTGSFLAVSGVDKIKYDGYRRIKLPYLGSVKLKCGLPEGVPYGVRIKKQNGCWYACVTYWKPPLSAEDKTHDFGGVDVGINPLAVDSDLTRYENPKALEKNLKKLGKWQRIQSRRKVGSRGWRAAQCRVDATQQRINNLRGNTHHQVSRHLVRKYAMLGIENLNVVGMDKLRHIARAVKDAAIGGLLLKIKYKSDWYGTFVAEANRFFPSSKLCSDCCYHNAALMRELYWYCPRCGVRHDRNENAAVNLKVYAMGVASDPKFFGLSAVGDLPNQNILGPVGPNVTLLDGKALANDNYVVSETGSGEGRTAPLTQEIEVDGGLEIVEQAIILGDGWPIPDNSHGQVPQHVREGTCECA